MKGQAASRSLGTTRGTHAPSLEVRYRGSPPPSALSPFRRRITFQPLPGIARPVDMICPCSVGIPQGDLESSRSGPSLPAIPRMSSALELPTSRFERVSQQIGSHSLASAPRPPPPAPIPPWVWKYTLGVGSVRKPDNGHRARPCPISQPHQ